MALVEWHQGILAAIDADLPALTPAHILYVDVVESTSTPEMVSEIETRYPSAAVHLVDEKVFGGKLTDDPAAIWGPRQNYNLILFMTCHRNGYENLYPLVKDRLHRQGTAVMSGPGWASGSAIMASSGLRTDRYHAYGIVHTVIASWP